MSLTKTALALVHSLSEHVPNFDQRIRKKYYSAILERDKEKLKPAHLKDDQKIILLNVKIERLLDAFKAEIQKAKK